MNNLNKELMDIVKISLSDIIAGFFLIIISVFVHFEMFPVLRNPVFNAVLGILFLAVAYVSSNIKEQSNNTERILNIDLNGITVGIFLLVVSVLGVTGDFGVVRNFLFPLIPGAILILIATSRLYVRATRTDINIRRIEPCGIVGGEVLVFYSVLLYLDMTSLAWSPIFPLFVSAALFTIVFIDVMPQIRSHETGIKNAVVWLDDIEEKISRLKSEFESIKLDENNPDVLESIERLNAIYGSLIELKEINDYMKQRQITPEFFEIPTPVAPLPTAFSASEPTVETVDAGLKAPDKSVKLGMEMKSNELEDLVGTQNNDEVFYENLQKEFDMHGLSDLIREAKEMRKSINAQRNDEDNQ